MPFIPLDLASQSGSIGLSFLIVFGAAAVLALIFTLNIFISAKAKPVEARGSEYTEAALFVSAAAVAFFIGLGLNTISIVSQPNSIGDLRMKIDANSERLPKIQSVIQGKYGLNLTEGEVSALQYPYDEPTTDFSVYGSFDKKEQVDGAQFNKSTIYLVWANGQFELSESKDGESFAPLETVK